jgi:hypothetical protein
MAVSEQVRPAFGVRGHEHGRVVGLAVLGRDDRAEPVPFHLEPVVANGAASTRHGRARERAARRYVAQRASVEDTALTSAPLGVHAATRLFVRLQCSEYLPTT